MYIVLQHSYEILFCLSYYLKSGIKSFLLSQKISFLIIIFFYKKPAK